MNIKLNKSKILVSDKNKDIVILNLDNLISFPVRILKKEDGDIIPILPKRNRKMNYGINTEYIEFTEMKYRDEFLNRIKDIYKKGEIEENITNIENETEEKEMLLPEIQIEYIPITNKYVTALLDITLYDKIKFKGFKIIYTSDAIKVTSPCFMKEKDLLNRFKISNKLSNIIISQANKRVEI